MDVGVGAEDQEGKARANKFLTGGHVQSARGNPEPGSCNAPDRWVTSGKEPGRPFFHPLPWEFRIVHRGWSESAKEGSEGNTAAAKGTHQSGSNCARVVLIIAADGPHKDQEKEPNCFSGVIRC